MPFRNLFETYGVEPYFSHSKDRFAHAGIYIGDGLMVHSSTYGTPVRVAPISSTPIHNARRY